MTVVVEMYWALAVDFEGGDFLEPSILLDCGSLSGFTAFSVAVLDGATRGRTSLFFLFAAGSNHSFVDGPLPRVAPPRAVWQPAIVDAVGFTD